MEFAELAEAASLRAEAELAGQRLGSLGKNAEVMIESGISELSRTGTLDSIGVSKLVTDSLLGAPGDVSVTKLAEDAESLGMKGSNFESLKNGLTELNQEISFQMKGIKGGPEMSYNEAINKLQTEGWTPTDGGIGIKQYIENKTSALSNMLNKLDPSVKPVESLKIQLKEKGVTSMIDPPVDPVEFNKKIDEAVTATAEKTTKIAKYFEESQTAQEAKEISETGKTSGKRMTYPKWLKALGMFTVMGEIGYAMWAFLEFARANSGCMMISNDGQNPETSEKVFCSGDQTYESQQCMCVKIIPSPPPSTSLCSSTTDTTRTPEINNIKCINYAELTPPYVYYSYKITTPIGGVLDIGSRIVGAAQSAASGFLTIVINYLKVAGLTVLAIGILYILYQVIKLGTRHYEK
jgi:hypothetical protein